MSSFQVGDHIKIIKPTCPVRNRRTIPGYKVPNVIKVEGAWTCFTCDSGVRTKRHPRNIILL